MEISNFICLQKFEQIYYFNSCRMFPLQHFQYLLNTFALREILYFFLLLNIRFVVINVGKIKM